MSNAFIDFSTMDCSVLALVSDVVVDGEAVDASQEALGLSLERAEEEGSSFERALTELAWADLFPDEGTADRRRSAEALLEGLGVVRIAVPSS